MIESLLSDNKWKKIAFDGVFMVGFLYPTEKEKVKNFGIASSRRRFGYYLESARRVCCDFSPSKVLLQRPITFIWFSIPEFGRVLPGAKSHCVTIEHSVRSLR